MKKLLIITDMFPDRYNPVSGIFVKHQVDELAKSYDVKVISTYFPRRTGVEQSSTGNYGVTHISFPLISNLFLSSLLFYRFYALKIIREVIVNWKPDLIHVHDCRHVPELVSLGRMLHKLKLPAFLTVHNNRTHPDMIASRKFKWLYKLWLGKAYRNWTHIFTVNSKLKSTIAEFVDEHKISVIGNGILPCPVIDQASIEKYKQMLSPTGFNIVSVGNLVKEKGFDILIRAVGKLLSKYDDIRLLIVGEGAERKVLEKLIATQNLERNVILAGRVENDLVRNLFGMFDVFVLASYRETFGIVYLEALDAGLPVIGVKGQGIDGVIIDGVEGYLVNPGDIEELSDKIAFLIQNKEKADSVARAGQYMVKSRYQLKDLIQRIIKVYEQ